MLAPNVRRFSPADLTDKAGWVLARLRTQYAHKSEVTLANWLRMSVNRNDCLFIRTDHAIAFAEIVVLDLMDEHPVIYERFVWCENRQNSQHVDEAATFYDEFARWARSMGIEKLIVNQSSDVPKERIKEAFRKVRVEEQLIARV